MVKFIIIVLVSTMLLYSSVLEYFFAKTLAQTDYSYQQETYNGY
jgi:hypothetical protein